MKFLDEMGDFWKFARLCRKNILSSAHEDARTGTCPASFLGPMLPPNNDDYLNLYLHNERACPAVISCDSCLDGIGFYYKYIVST